MTVFSKVFLIEQPGTMNHWRSTLGIAVPDMGKDEEKMQRRIHEYPT
jgi:hypothetical protein